MNYDIIGDIHGHADALKALLSDLGYAERERVWRHPDRQAVFLGDFIDRGPKQVETVGIVRRMVDAGAAQAVMGNHELNAIAWFTKDPSNPGEYLRPHRSTKYGDKNYAQHKAFLDEVDGTPAHQEIIDWFLSLSLWLDLEEIRVVHACWHQRFMDSLAPQLGDANCLTEQVLFDATREPEEDAEKDTPDFSVFKAAEALTKGIEIPLPKPHSFTDKDGHQRFRVRTRWWDSTALTYRNVAMLSDEERSTLPDEEIPTHVRLGQNAGKPLFIGHYWLTGTPRLLSDSVACLDYSVAKGGKLVAYRWDGESTLENSKLHWIGKEQL